MARRKEITKKLFTQAIENYFTGMREKIEMIEYCEDTETKHVGKVLNAMVTTSCSRYDISGWFDGGAVRMSVVEWIYY